MSDESSRPLIGAEETSVSATESSVHEEFAAESEFERLIGGILDSASECLVVVDERGRIMFANRAARPVFGYDPDELVGERLAVLMPDRLTADFLDGFQRYLRSGDRSFDWAAIEFPGRRKDASEVPLQISVEEYVVDDRQYFIGVMRDVSDRVQRENELSTERAFVDSIFDALPDVVYAFDRDGQFLRWNDRLTEITGYSDAEVATMHALEFIAEDDQDAVANGLLDVFESGTIESVEAEVVTSDGERIPFEFTGAPLTDDDGSVVGLTGVGRDITERRRRERRLEQLNALNTVIRAVDEALIEATTRSEVETAVCERLAAADIYVGAVIGDVDADGDEFDAWADAGVDTDAYETLLLPADGHTAESIAARAIETRSAQVVDLAESEHESRRRDAERQGYGCLAAVPIVREDRTFGVLGVYAARDRGFPDREREILSELGRVIGNALQNAITRELLHADSVTEIELESTDEDLTFVSLSEALDCRIELDRVLSFGEDLVFYVRVSETSVDAFEGAVEGKGAVESVEHLGTNEGEHLFKLNVRKGTLTSVLAEYGAQTTAAKATDGVTRLVAHVSPDVDVRELVEALTENFPATELKARRETSRTLRTPVAFREELSADLTEKQWAALQAAYFSGYFEWPSRSSNASEIAEVLDIAPQTFHQHLRIAEQKVFRSLFGDNPSDGAV